MKRFWEMGKKPKTLEEITAEEIVNFVLSEGSQPKKELVGSVEEMLREYADNWARDNAKDYMIDHAYP